MAKFDAEDLLDSVLSIMTTGGALNTKIAAIDAEKIANGKGLVTALKTVDASAYFLQSWSQKVLNYSPAIFYGIEDCQAMSKGPSVAKTYKIFVEVVLIDDGMTNDSSKRIQRYSRALEELFGEALLNGGTDALPSSQVTIDSVRPMAFRLALDSDDEVKVGGISLTISLV